MEQGTKLKDGDVTDAKMREIVVRELNDVKSKLDGLSRKDLLTSYRFLKEGVDFLNVCMNKAKLEQKGNSGLLSPDVHHSKSELPSGGHFEVLNECLELPHVMGKLKIYLGTEFESAIKRFEDARKKATDAFCNEALNIKDRIFAAKLRIVSKILECLDSPETAITGCLSFLQDLHSLPAIRETFYVYLRGGVKSWVGKAEREENVKSIMMINYVLFDLNQKFSRQITDRVTWPGAGIELPGRSFNPISDWQEVSTRNSMPRELGHPANEIIFDEQIHPRCLTINSRGDVVTNGEWGGNNILVFSKKSRKVANLPAAVGEGEAILRQNIIALAVDDKDNVYIVRCLEIRNVLRGESDFSYELIVLTGCFDVHHACTLEFLKTTNRLFVTGMAINKYNHLIFLKSNVCKVYVVETTGELLNTFTPDLQVWPTCLGISNRNEIIISTPRDMASIDDVKVHFYSEE